eukprot:CAMPEP_0198145502 /NCGR_PEP_ID=MMETSP1443-20131203/23958_1 /TAXON_ID=186043 /ORGANISM="Entomoneis sp., Strain CCMP2396" /LENGTH=502 /DNA_ID=CAMNT_0043809177 /DNA_START=1 /DNA_END=1506 /DNA_ORIENTATION=-
MMFSTVLLSAAWLLMSSGGTAAEMVNVNVNYTYTCFRDISLTIQQAYDTIDSEGLAYLVDKIEGADVDATILNFTSYILSSCSDAVRSASENLGACVEAEGSVWVNVDGDIRYDLVEKLAVSKVQSFINGFNDKYASTIHIGYNSPIAIKTTVVFRLGGVRTALTAADMARLKAEIIHILAPILAAGSPPFLLTDIKLVTQQPAITNSRRRRTFEEVEALSPSERELQTITGNNVEVLLVGNCANIDGQKLCTREAIKAKAEEVSAENAQIILSNLQEEAGDRDYFDRINEISVNEGASILTINVTEVLDKTEGILGLTDNSSTTTDEEEVPFWLWILAGGTAGVLFVGGIWAYVAVTYRNREAVLRKAFEDNHRQSMSSKSPSKTTQQQEQPPRRVFCNAFGRRNNNDADTTSNNNGYLPATPVAQLQHEEAVVEESLLFSSPGGESASVHSATSNQQQPTAATPVPVNFAPAEPVPQEVVEEEQKVASKNLTKDSALNEV